MLFIVYFPKDCWFPSIWIYVCGYLAWSFKQGTVFAAGGVGLFLLIRREWMPLIVLSTVLPLAWGLTIYFGDPQYVYNFLLKDFPVFFSPNQMFRNLVNLGVRSVPILLFLTG